MISVLFVCKGNICRSPMAEAVFRDLVKREGLESTIRVDSAGTREWHQGKPPHTGTQKVLDQHGISWEGILARQLIEEDLQVFDLIVGMDEQNRASIQEKFQSDKTIYLLREFIPESEEKEVPDPYHTGNFDETYQLVKLGCERLLEFIRSKETRPL